MVMPTGIFVEERSDSVVDLKRIKYLFKKQLILLSGYDAKNLLFQILFINKSQRIVDKIDP